MEEEQTEKEYILNEPRLRAPMPLMNTSYTPGHVMDALDTMRDADCRRIAQAEYFYFSGCPKKASEIAEEYLAHDDLALRLSACWIYTYACLALDRITGARQAMAQIRATAEGMDADASQTELAYAACIAMGANVLLHLPIPPEKFPDSRKFLPLLPPGLRLFGLYVQAHYAYLQQYGACIGIAETALSIESTLYPIPTIYLHLAATMGYINLRQTEKAREHLLEAWEIARPDGLIEAFGEHHGLLGGMLEAVLRKDYPDDFRRIIDITYRFSAGWRKIHNPDTGRQVADDLTTMEFTIAMLAARGWSNKEIGAHLHISPNTVKMHISSVLRRLDIPTRKELAKYMLE
ncbi:MAG: LuxR C-terminal-related transcriptional regulator [Lachnospiraceae bacterium]|nr:LuxR C-terminal-related transcriptional regulator [Lachnospiraceae bacterium]